MLVFCAVNINKFFYVFDPELFAFVNVHFFWLPLWPFENLFQSITDVNSIFVFQWNNETKFRKNIKYTQQILVTFVLLRQRLKVN